MENKQNSNKRKTECIKYIDEIQTNNSKINMVRVDLSYTKPYSQEVTLEQANKDINRMLNNRRSKPSIFEHNIGYIIKREYTEDKGVHMHGFFIFDGQKVQKDSYKADEVGKYWNETITKGKGCYHNCNRNANKYENNGIGMIDHKDTLKRKNLDSAIEYLCKDEQSIKAISTNKKDRAITRGTIPKSKGKAGRPRK